MKRLRGKPEKANVPFVQFPKGAYTVDELAVIHTGGRSKIYEAIADDRLIARKDGGKTIVLHSDYMAFLDGLPIHTLSPKAPAAGEVQG